MPRRDGTGPEGAGPKTGRGVGNCGSKADRKQPAGQAGGQGRGRGAGRGKGGRGGRNQD